MKYRRSAMAYAISSVGWWEERATGKGAWEVDFRHGQTRPAPHSTAHYRRGDCAALASQSKEKIKGVTKASPTQPILLAA